NRPRWMKISVRLTATRMPGTISGASTKTSTARFMRNGTRPSAQAVGSASTTDNAVTMVAMTRLRASAERMPGEPSTSSQNASEKDGGSSAGANQPFFGSTSDQSVATASGTASARMA